MVSDEFLTVSIFTASSFNRLKTVLQMGEWVRSSLMCFHASLQTTRIFWISFRCIRLAADRSLFGRGRLPRTAVGLHRIAVLRHARRFCSLRRFELIGSIEAECQSVKLSLTG